MRGTNDHAAVGRVTNVLSNRVARVTTSCSARGRLNWFSLYPEAQSTERIDRDVIFSIV